jgi:hypothetical protein
LGAANHLSAMVVLFWARYRAGQKSRLE